MPFLRRSAALVWLIATISSSFGQAFTASVSTPFGTKPVARITATDGQGTFYYADYRTNSVGRYTLDGGQMRIAGTLSSGFADGFGTSARFNGPSLTVPYLDGSLLVVDSANFAVRKVSAAGQVTTLVGGASGFADGQGSAGKFSYVGGLAVDSQGNIYLADSGNLAVRKITPAGEITTIVQGVHDSNGATNFMPLDVAVDSENALYVAEGTSRSVKLVAADGSLTQICAVPTRFGTEQGPIQFTTIKATGRGELYMEGFYFRDYVWKRDSAGSVTEFGEGPVLVDKAGNVYLLGKETWTKFSPQGQATVLAAAPGTAGYADGRGREVKFNYPGGLCRDSQGNVYVADTGNNVIRKISTDGVVTTFAGSTEGFVDGVGTQAKFNKPQGLAIDSSGVIYVADTYNHAIRAITPDGEVGTLAGTGAQGWKDGIRVFAQFNLPQGVAVNSKYRIVYVADTGNDAIRACYRDLNRVGTISTDHLSAPTGMTIDDAGNLYIANSVADVILEYTALGDRLVFAGSYHTGLVDGLRTDAWFDNPRALAVDSKGFLYVADTWNQAIRMISPHGTVTTLAGGSERWGVDGLPGFADGVGAEAQFHSPSGICVDDSGAMYVSDTFNNTVRRAVMEYPSGPTFIEQPMSQIQAAGGNIEFTVAVGGATDTTYRWEALLAGSSTWTALSNDATYGGVTTAKLTVTGVTDAMNGMQLRCVATVTATTITSNSATLTVGQPPTPPSITKQPDDITAQAGTRVVFSVSATGTGQLYYHWSRHGISLFGQDQPTLTLDPVTLFDADTYRVEVGNEVGSVWSRTATLTVTPSSDPGTPPSPDPTPEPPTPPPPPAKSRFVNISSRAYCGVDEKVTIGGFVIAGTGPKRVLVRAVGPTLTGQGISPNDVLVDPTVELHRGAPVIATNDDWVDAPNKDEIVAKAAQIGATPISANDTKSAALLLSLEPGVYTFVTSGKNRTSGVVLLEVYDADPDVTTASFVNIATRAYATTGSGPAIGGFVISGNANKQVLVRALGPTLSSQGIAQGAVLADPTIELHDTAHGNVVLATNDNWGANTNAAEITSAGSRIGAVPIEASDAKSSALLFNVPPGVYTFVASGKSAGSGIVLIEVYDAD